MLGITMGDAAGVGAEVIVKALAKQPELRDECVVYGGAEVLEYYNKLLKYSETIQIVNNLLEARRGAINVIEPVKLAMSDFELGKVSPLCGGAAFRCLEAAVEDAMSGAISAIVTAPLNKEAMNLAGFHYDGHTGALMHLTGCERCAMLLWSGKLKVIHVTTHVSMRRACDMITRERVRRTIELADETLRRAGYVKPRIAVAGLNAHAGENGLFGDEEIKEIAPAVTECAAAGIEAAGPLPPDTVFLRCFKGEFDIVVAMYHDQGHIPLKLLGFDDGVNISAGLPIVRTSVDHGTAFDIAGKGIANEQSLLAAVECARLFAKK